MMHKDEIEISDELQGAPIDLGDGRGERPLSEILLEAELEIAAAERMHLYVEKGRLYEH